MWIVGVVMERDRVRKLTKPLLNFRLRMCYLQLSIHTFLKPAIHFTGFVSLHATSAFKRQNLRHYSWIGIIKVEAEIWLKYEQKNENHFLLQYERETQLNGEVRKDFFFFFAPLLCTWLECSHFLSGRIRSTTQRFFYTWLLPVALDVTEWLAETCQLCVCQVWMYGEILNKRMMK